MDAVRSRIERGETLRVWYSNAPNEMCGLYWLMSLLNLWKQSSAKVALVKLPEWETEEETLIQHNGWGEVEPGKRQGYLSLQKTASPAFIRAAAFRWAGLQMENAPLRVIINGKLQSVPENFYDNFILREIAVESSQQP